MLKNQFNRYVKKKKLERLDTYVPPLLEARGQLIRVGRVMREWLLPAALLGRTRCLGGVRGNCMPSSIAS